MTNPELPLFRPAAVAARRHDWRGRIVLARPASFAVLAAFLAAVAGSLAAFAYFGSYTAHSTLRGRVVPERGIIDVASTQAGTIAEKRVVEGQRVAAGDVLYVLASERLTRAGIATEQEVAVQLARRRDSLGEQIARTHALEQVERAALGERRAAVRAEGASLDETIEAERRRSDLAAATAERYAKMQALGFVAEEQLSLREAALLEQRSRVEGLERERAGLARIVAELDGRSATLGLEYANAIAELERAVAGVELEIAENDARRAVTVAAPQAGVVTAPAWEVGQSVERATVLARIVPEGSTLVAELLAPSRAVGFVAVGDEVRLRYASFPYQKFGHALGSVVSVSQATLGAGNPVPTNGVVRSEPVYRVAVELQSQTVTAYGEPRRLLPGMEVEADVLLETRRLYEWVLEPLYAMAGRLER
jgi:membrane fusion protein